MAASGGASSVFVKRSGDESASFAEVPILVGDTVTRLAERASTKFAWPVGADKVKLFLVRSDRAQSVERGDESEGVGGALFSGSKLADVEVVDGCFVLARLSGPPRPPGPPAAAPGECARAARSLLSCSPSRGPEGLAGRARDSAVVFAGRSPFSDLAYLPSFAGGGGGGSNAAAAAGGGGGGGSSSEPAITFERLLEDGGMRRSAIEASAALRARLKYGHLVAHSIMERRPDLAVEAYELGKRLPSTATVRELQVAGYTVNGLLHEGSELAICFKDSRVHLLKGLRDDEAARARGFLAALVGRSVPHVTPFELMVSEGGKNVMIMPKFATTLEPLPYLSPAGVEKMWAQLQEALECLHRLDFAHADVKPGNICLSEDANSFYLIDLGSIARFGDKTSSTVAYVPRDMKRGRSSAALDWWMLAATLAEKACGSEHALEVGGARQHSVDELREHLAAHLDPAVWAELQPRLQ